VALVEGPPLQAAAAVRVLVALPLTVSHDFFGALWLLWQTGDCVRVTSGMQIPADLLLISASAVSPESSLSAADAAHRRRSRCTGTAVPRSQCEPVECGSLTRLPRGCSTRWAGLCMPKRSRATQDA
jgi:hypothetical protein